MGMYAYVYHGGERADTTGNWEHTDYQQVHKNRAEQQETAWRSYSVQPVMPGEYLVKVAVMKNGKTKLINEIAFYTASSGWETTNGSPVIRWTEIPK